MKPIAPKQRDGIPREVATAMLTEPRARLTNRMRKVCKTARQTVYASTSPIVWQQTSTDAGDVFRRYYTEREQPPREAKTEKRFRIATLAQLARWLKRATARRAVVQRRYLAVPNSDVPKLQARFDATRAALATIAQHLDTIRDCAEDEVERRASKCDKIEAIRVPFRSTVKFFARCRL